MKLHLLLTILGFILLSCQSEPKQQQQKEEPIATQASTSKQPISNTTSTTSTSSLASRELCFITNKPTTQGISELQLNIEGKKVKGTYNWLPTGKEAAKGQLLGLLRGNTISAIWNFNTEEGHQKQEVIFKLDGDKVWVKKGNLVEDRERLQLKNADNIDFTEYMNKVDCNQK